MPKLKALQSLRAIAALLVVLNHSVGVAAGHGFPRDIGTLADFIGSQGVAIFFLISGFIMTYTADTPENGASAPSRALSFAGRRIARVVPLYWFLTLLVAGIAALLGFSKALDTTAAHLLKSLFFIPYVNAQGVMLPVMPLGWTLNYEMFFYALFAVFLLLPHRYRVPSLVMAMAALVGVGAGIYPVMSGTLPHSVGALYTHPVILLFAAGALLGWVRVRYPQWQVTLPGVLLAAPLVALNCAVVVGKPLSTPIHLSWYLLFWSVDLLVVALCVFGHSLSHRLLEKLGDASYSLYLVHILPLFACFVVWQAAHFAMPPAFIAASVVTSSLTAYGCYRWVERPLSKMAGRLLSPRPSEPAVEPVESPALQQV